MTRIFYFGLEAALAGVFLVPLLLLLNRRIFHDGKRTALCLLFTLYLAAMWAAVGMPNVTYLRLDWNLNVIPFAGMLQDLKNSILNVLLFLPLGIFLPVLWQDYRSGRKTVLFGFFLSAGIELLQIFTYRATDVNDLITNTLGTFLGWLASRVLCQRLPASFPGADTKELRLLLISVFAVMFFIQPFLETFLWSIL